MPSCLCVKNHVSYTGRQVTSSTAIVSLCKTHVPDLLISSLSSRQFREDKEEWQVRHPRRVAGQRRIRFFHRGEACHFGGG